MRRIIKNSYKVFIFSANGDIGIISNSYLYYVYIADLYICYTVDFYAILSS